MNCAELVPRCSLQKSLRLGREGRDEGLKVEGDFTFGRLQEGFKGALRGLKRASRWLEGGFKGASPSKGFKGARRELQGGFKGAWMGLKPSEGEGSFERLEGSFERLEEGFKVAWRGLQGGFTFERLQGGSKGASRGLQGGLNGLEAFWRWRKLRKTWRKLRKASRGTSRELQGDLKGTWSLEASKGLKGLKEAAFSAEAGFEDACKRALHQRFGHV